MKTRVFAIIKEEEKTLLIRESNPDWKKKWYFPGGLVDDLERPIDALVREIREETGYEAGVNGIFLICYRSKPQVARGLYVFCSARIVGGELKLRANEHSLEAEWLTIEQISGLDTRDDLLSILYGYNEGLPLLSFDQLQVK